MYRFENITSCSSGPFVSCFSSKGFLLVFKSQRDSSKSFFFCLFSPMLSYREKCMAVCGSKFGKQNWRSDSDSGFRGLSVGNQVNPELATEEPKAK